MEVQALNDDFRTNGWTLIRGAVPKEIVNRHNHILDEYRRSLGRNRLAIHDLHVDDERLLSLLQQAKIQEALQALARTELSLFSSVNFAFGSQSACHIDASHFNPMPLNALFGVWIALEDISPLNGPFYVYNKSHKLPFLYSCDLAGSNSTYKSIFERLRSNALNAEESMILIKVLNQIYGQTLRERIRDERSEFISLSKLKSGDAIIYNGLLAHGGQMTINPSATRRSAVFFMINSDARIFNRIDFFQYSKNELANQPGINRILRKKPGQLVIDQRTHFTTYDDKDPSNATTHDIQPDDTLTDMANKIKR